MTGHDDVIVMVIIATAAAVSFAAFGALAVSSTGTVLGTTLPVPPEVADVTGPVLIVLIVVAAADLSRLHCLVSLMHEATLDMLLEFQTIRAADL
jgi:hypothetical protein